MSASIEHSTVHSRYQRPLLLESASLSLFADVHRKLSINFTYLHMNYLSPNLTAIT